MTYIGLKRQRGNEDILEAAEPIVPYPEQQAASFVLGDNVQQATTIYECNRQTQSFQHHECWDSSKATLYPYLQQPHCLRLVEDEEQLPPPVPHQRRFQRRFAITASMSIDPKISSSYAPVDEEENKNRLPKIRRVSDI